MWAVVLEAANGDPLRAMQMEVELSEEWWVRYVQARRARAEAEQALKDNS